jgi:hypothetical protein
LSGGEGYGARGLASQAGLGRPGATVHPHYEGLPIVRLRRHRRTAGNRRDQRLGNLLRQGVRDVPVCDRTVLQPKIAVMARREALRWAKADVSAGAHRMDYPNCASWRVIPLIVEGETREVQFARWRGKDGACAREIFPGHGCLTWWIEQHAHTVGWVERQRYPSPYAPGRDGYRFAQPILRTGDRHQYLRRQTRRR